MPVLSVLSWFGRLQLSDCDLFYQSHQSACLQNQQHRNQYYYHTNKACCNKSERKICTVLRLVYHWATNRESASIALNDSDDNAKDSKRAGKNLHNQNFDKKAGILCITNSTGRSSNSNGYSRRNVCQANTQASREHAVSSIVISIVIPILVQVVSTGLRLFDFVRQNNSHNNAIDCRCFAENDTVWQQPNKNRNSLKKG